MKKLLLVCTVLLLVPIAGRCQLWLHAGDSFVYEFSNPTYAGPVTGSSGATLEIGMSGVDGSEGVLVEIFENSAGGDAPLLIFPDVRFIPNPIVLGNAWSDRQGAVRFTVMSGSVSLDILRAAVVYPNGEMYVEIFDIMDSDGDGVLDHRDHCPNSAPGVMVDARGCSDAQIPTTIISGSGSPIYGFVARRDTFTAVSWSQTNTYRDVKITARLGSMNFPGLVDKGTAYLTTRMGPGTTEADEVAVASFAFPGTLSPSDVLLFSGLTLGPGTYYLSVAGGSFSSWYGALGPGLTTDLGVMHNGNFYVPQSATYPPASIGLAHPQLFQLFSVTGTIRPNLPPLANAGTDQRLECSGTTTSVLLDGRESRDPDGEALVYRWSEGTTLLGVGPTLNVGLSTGSHDVRLVVTDASGESAEDSVLVQIEDTTAPQIKAVARAAVLWPPNGRMVPVVIKARILDACDATASARIVAVKSNKPSGGRNDWQITGPLTLKLKARKGRTYRVTVEASDASANKTRTTVSIVVGRGR